MGTDAGAPVMVWMGPNDELPIGARVVGAADQLDRVWLDVCSIGQHIPQMFRPQDCTALDADVARAHGLCPDCLGYGSTEAVPTGAGVDQVPSPCEACGGTGRTALRARVTRSESGVVGRLESVMHEPVTIEGKPYCLACGFPRSWPAAAHPQN